MTPGKSNSSLAFVRTKGKKIYIVAIFSRFGSFSHHTVCSGPNQLKRTKMQSRDNIRFTCWLGVTLNAFPTLLFDWSERACEKIPTVLPEVIKDRSKMQQTAHCYYGETTAWVDFNPGHPLLNHLYIYHFRQYITFENEAQMRLENNVLMHCKQRRRIASHQISMRLRTSSQPQVCPRPAMLHCKLSTNTSSSYNAQRS